MDKIVGACTYFQVLRDFSSRQECAAHLGISAGTVR